MAAYYTTERIESSDASAEPSLDINDEIALLKEKFGPDCNVMHVISIIFQDLNVKLKLQVSGGYPAVPVGVLVSDDLSGTESTIPELCQFLQKKRHVAASLTGCVEMTRQWLSENYVTGVSSQFQIAERKKKKTKKIEVDEADDDSSKKVAGHVVENQKPANYFVCVRITNPDIIANVKAVQSSITKIDPRFVKCYYNSSILHLTTCMVGLDTELQIRNACQALKKNRFTLAEIARRGVTYHVSGVDHFHERVLYAKVKPSASLDEFVTSVRRILTDAGVEIREGNDYTPHITMMKLSMDRAFKFDRLPPFTYQNFRNKDFGEQLVESIDICAMSRERDKNGFYVSPLHMDFFS